MTDEFMLRHQIKALHQRLQGVERRIAEVHASATATLEATLQPLHEEADECGRQMDALLGQSKSWIVGHYDADGLPVFENEPSP
jgi:hypothetical protein